MPCLSKVIFDLSIQNLSPTTHICNFLMVLPTFSLIKKKFNSMIYSARVYEGPIVSKELLTIVDEVDTKVNIMIANLALLT